MQVTRPTFIPLLAPAGNDGYDPSALREGYCGDLTVVYTFGPQFGRRVVTAADLDQLGLTPRTLRRSALDHLEVLASRAQFHGQPPALMLSFEGLESSLLLANDLWARLNGSVPGELIVGVPARDVVIITGSQSVAGMEKVRRAVDRVFFAGDEHLLTRTLLVRRAGAWEPFDSSPRMAPARPARPLVHHRGPDQPPRQYQEHPSWPTSRVPVTTPPLVPAAGMTGFNVPVASTVPPRPVFTGMMPAIGPHGMPPQQAPQGYTPPPAMPQPQRPGGPVGNQQYGGQYEQPQYPDAGYGDPAYGDGSYAAVPYSAIPYSAMPNSAMSGPATTLPPVVYPAQPTRQAQPVEPMQRTGHLPAVPVGLSSQTGYHPAVTPPTSPTPAPQYPNGHSAREVYPPGPYSMTSFSDALYPDASYPDASYPDASYADASYADASYPDASYPDASYPDASYPDASYPNGSYQNESYPQEAYGREIGYAPHQQAYETGYESEPSYPQSWGPAPEPVSQAVLDSRAGPRARFTR